ncbi:MAG: hypothetical protein RBJ76_13440 [Stenomitos frigidus ULC029]
MPREAKEEATKESRKTGIGWFDALPGAVQMLVLIGGLGVSISFLIFLTGLFNTTPRKTVKQIPAVVPGEVQVEQPKPQASDPELLWKAVGIDHSNLLHRVDEMDDQVRKARAQAWTVQAQTKCSQTPGCRNYYQWLLSSYQYYATQLAKDLTYQERALLQDAKQRPTVIATQKLVLNTTTINEYRANRDLLLDLAAAMATAPNTISNSPGLVPSNELIESIKAFGASTANWEGNKPQPVTNGNTKTEQGMTD